MAKIIDNYGRLSNRIAYDPDKAIKLWCNAQPKWDLDEYFDILYLLIWQLLTFFMLRDRKEIQIMKTV